jgi:hypothetical protein
MDDGGSLSGVPLVGAPSPDTEAQRQLAVTSLGLSSGVVHPRLDRISRMAQKFFDATASSITVLDHDRAFFPGSAGLDLVEAERDQTFCETTTRLGDVVVVEDALADDRFNSLGVVTDLGLRFYAGAPLRDGEGNVVATFCVFDDKPRRFDANEMATFLDMASWAQQELVESTEMLQASQVQASMQPEGAVHPDGWEVDGLCVPALSVGGDFYDFSTANGVVHLAIGDVMGKGTGAALLGAGIRSALRGTLSAVSAGVDLGVTVTQIGLSQLPDLERAGSFVTLFQAAIDTEDGRLRYVDAGSGLALLVGLDGNIDHLHGHDRPLGVLPEDFWTEHERTMAPGDRLVVFSDGLLDLLDDEAAWVGEIGRLAERLPRVPDLLDAVRGLTRSRTPLDDVTAVVVRRSGGPV